MNQWDFTAPFEGIIPHLYLDTAGYVTAGVGFMLPKLVDAQALDWAQPVSSDDVTRDWYTVRAVGAGKLPRAYRIATECRLSEAGMRAEFDRRMALVSYELARVWRDFDALPAPAQLAIKDMAWNCGVGSLRRHWPKFRAAVDRRDWQTCAKQCRRRGIQESRNDATRKLFESLIPEVLA